MTLLDPLQPLAAHLPALLLRRVVEHGGLPEAGGATAIRGAALYFDVSGFTRFTEQASASGSQGAETVLSVTNAYFGTILKEAAGFGGDAIFFAGDSLLLVFEADAAEESLAAVALRATLTALRTQQAIARMSAPDALTLGLRASVGVGEMVAMELGGEGGRWMLAVDGDALDESFRLNRIGQAGDVVVSDRVWNLIEPHARGARVDNDSAVRVLSIHQTSEIAIASPQLAPVHPDLPVRLESYLLQVVVDRVRAGLSAFMAEFRATTVLYANFPTLAPRQPAERDALQQAIRTLQVEVARHDGVVREVIRDDKGTNVIVAFGLPPTSHEDSAVRATRCAVSLQRVFDERRIHFRAGIASGTLFCGEYGTLQRRNYSLVGATMNRAARLMQAVGDRGLLSDESTRKQAGRRARFDALPPIALKGIADSVPVFRPSEAATGATAVVAALPTLVGRRDELAHIERAARALRESRQGACILVQADAGMGKSTLFGRAAEAMARDGLDVFVGHADSIERATSFFALRPVFRRLLGIDPDASPELRAEQLVGWFERQLPARLELAPLLNIMLGVDLPESALSAQLEGVIRAENLRDLLTEIIRNEAAYRSLVFAIEDAHWLDAASWGLFAALADEALPVLLLFTTRPTDVTTPELETLAKAPWGTTLGLGPLGDDEVVEVLRYQTGATDVDSDVRELVVRRAEGNPFYAEEIAWALLESGAIAVEARRLKAVQGADALRALDLPATVTGVITSRIDSLAPSAQLTLKVASVVGRTFETRAVRSIHPVQEQFNETQLQVLASASLIIPEGGREPSHAFRHALTHETTYQLMALAQRRPLHKAAAEYIEALFPGADRTPWFSRLAFHWTEADDLPRAVHYLALAGEQALAASNLRAGIEAFTRALKLDVRLRGEPSVSLDRARWHRMLCECFYSLTDYTTAAEHAKKAIHYCGMSVPRPGVATVMELTRLVAGRLRGEPQPVQGEVRERYIEALRANDLLMTVCLWLGDVNVFVHGIVQFANVARHVGVSAESARQLSILGYFQLMVGLYDLADRDLQEAVTMAESVDSQLQLTSTLVTYGLYLNSVARHLDAIPLLRRAHATAERLGARLWKHRSAFQLAEALMMAGQLAEAAELFGQSAAAARGAEFSVVGFANGERAQCWLWMGRPVEDCLDLITGPDGIALTRGSKARLQYYTVLGVWIECLLTAGRWSDVLALAREGLAMASDGDECYSFVRGVDGHTGVALGLAVLWNRRRSGDPAYAHLPPASELEKLSRQATRNLGRCAKRFPAARPRWMMARGGLEYCAGRPEKARKFWQQAWEEATRQGLVWERIDAAFHIGRSLEGPERRRWLGLSESLARETGMLRLAERAANPPPAP